MTAFARTVLNDWCLVGLDWEQPETETSKCFVFAAAVKSSGLSGVSKGDTALVHMHSVSHYDWINKEKNATYSI